MFLFIPLDGNGNAIIFQPDSFASIQLDNHRILQFINNFCGYSLMKYIDDNSATDIPSEALNWDILYAFNFIGYVDR